MSIRKSHERGRKLGLVLLTLALVSCDKGDNPGSPDATPGPPSLPAGSRLVYAINAGGSSTTLNNVRYRADQFYSGGATVTTADPIAEVSKDTLYQSERYGNYKYEVPVTNATYSLKLHFTELYHTTAGSRLFTVKVEGQPVIANLDIYEKVGHDRALEIIVPEVAVEDSSLTVELEAAVNNGTISGLAIYSNSGGKFVPPAGSAACDLPDKLKWTSSPPLILPKDGFINVKDPSIVFYGDRYHVFATAFANAYRSIYLSFTDFDQASTASHTEISPGAATVAPHVFYFRPHKRWYIFTQWPVKYTTSENISNPSSWAEVKPVWPDAPEGHAAAVDYWVICNEADCYMFFFKNNGTMYQVKTPIGNFPNFDIREAAVSTVENSGGRNVLFEGGNVYKLKGLNKYLLMVEGWGVSEKQRLYRAWTSTTLDGPWTSYKTSEEEPFAGMSNVSYPDGQWSEQISHGEMVRAGWDETMELDACNMQFLYQGVDVSKHTGAYDARPYKLGLLTAE